VNAASLVRSVQLSGTFVMVTVTAVPSCLIIC
jgi:hypothetical protein